MARSLKFGLEKVELLKYLCSENKGADQLCSDCTADLHFFAYARSRFSQEAHIELDRYLLPLSREDHLENSGQCFNSFLFYVLFLAAAIYLNHFKDNSKTDAA